jgi:type I restriction enzyme, S subunit
MSEIVESKLPSTWKLVRLGDIAKTTSGGTPRRDRPQYYGGQIPWVKSGELGDSVVYETAETITDEALKSSNAKVFPKGTLCIALYGATVGKLGILGIDAATNQAVCAIFPPEGLDTRYLYRFFESKRRDLIEQGKGGAQSNISQGIIRDTQIPVAPPSEQLRIVAEIEKQFTRLEAGMAALRRAQANLKRYRIAVLNAACEGRLVPTEAEIAKTGKRKSKFETGEALLARILTERRQNWQGRGQYKDPAALDTAELPQLPEGWTWATLDQIGQEGRPIIYGIIKPGPHIPNGVPYVRVTEMKDGRIDVPNLKRASRERAAKFARATLASGDVLISKDGTIGRVAVVPPELAGGNITQHVMRAPIHAMMLRDYVVWSVRSDWCQHWLTGETRGVALRGVNVEDFRHLPIPVPPLAEQTRIVGEVERRLSVVEELESVVTANLQRAARLRQSILQKAFTGDLTGDPIPQESKGERP